MAVCDTAQPPALTAAGNLSGKNKEVEQNPEAAEDAAGSAGTAGGGTGSRDRQRQKSSRAGTSPKPEMPHQRNGHTCFVWDPRDEVLAACGGGASSTLAGGKRGDTTSSGRGEVRQRNALRRSGGFGGRA